MNPILWQKQLRDNAADLNNFYKDLKVWGEDMKTKDDSGQTSNVSNKPPCDKKKNIIPKNKVITDTYSESIDKRKHKFGCTDYTAWDKFDAETECEKVDYNENEESELSDECDETVRDKAYLEKEKGNKFVKDCKWDEAIECYSKAIDCYTYDPIFYANRALCFLKKENYVKAEVDCTMSLKLDKTYVKAYQRRAAASVALNKLQEAKADLLKVLELEPQNKESKKMLDNLRAQVAKIPKVKHMMENSQRPVSKFTASRIERKDTSKLKFYNNYYSGKIQSEVFDSAELGKDEPNEMDIIIVKAISKPVHLKSKQPLKEINIEEVNHCNQQATSRSDKNSFPRTDKIEKTFNTDDLKIIEKYSNKIEENACEIIKENKNHINTIKTIEEQIELVAPTNSVQFYSQWRHLKRSDDKYLYMKLIKPENLAFLFKESFESCIFSEMLEILVKFYIKNNEEVFNFLKCLTVVRRFSTITMFISDNDKNHLWKLFDYIREREEHPKEELDLLIRNYGLEN